MTNEFGVNPEASRRLASSGSVVAHDHLAVWHEALRWVFANGLESRPAERVTNDRADRDYAILGSFCAEFITFDEGPRLLCDDIKAASSIREKHGLGSTRDDPCQEP